jgi:O-antigen/teichoic acid export membrane protein
LAGVLKWYLATVIAGSIASRMDVFFVSSFSSVREAGIYGAAQMFALVPQLLGTYLSAVFSPRVLPLWRDGRLPQIFVRYQIALCALAVLSYALSCLAVGPLSSTVLPGTYARATNVILTLLPSGLVALITFPWTIPFILYTRPKTLLLADCIAIPVMAVVFAAVIPTYGALGAAAVTSGFAGLRLVFYQTLAWRVLRGDPAGAQWRASSAGTALQLARSAS